MNVYISMLRGVNVSGQKKIKMDALKGLYESLGFNNVKTYIQSGNAIFETTDSDVPELTDRIEQKIEEVFQFSVPIILRTNDSFKKLIDGNPYYADRNVDVTKLYVTFLFSSPSDSSVESLDRLDYGSDEFTLIHEDIYLFCPGGYGKTKLSNSFLEKKLGVTATTRNWKTVNKLYELSIQ